MSCHKLTGTFTRPITVTTNDPDNPTVRLFCKGQILEPYIASAKRLTFNKISRNGPPITKKVFIERGDAGPLRLTLSPITKKGVSAELRELVPGEKYEIEVTAAPPFDSDRIFTMLNLHTGLPQAPSGTIGVTVSVKARVAVNPRRFIIPRSPKPGWEQSVRLVWDDGAPHKILGATVNDPGLSVTVRETEQGQEVVLSASEAYEPRTGKRAVIINTDDPELKAIQVSIAPDRRIRPQRARTSFKPLMKKTKTTKTTKGTEAVGATKTTGAIQAPKTTGASKTAGGTQSTGATETRRTNQTQSRNNRPGKGDTP